MDTKIEQAPRVAFKGFIKTIVLILTEKNEAAGAGSVDRKEATSIGGCMDQHPHREQRYNDILQNG